MWLSYINYFSLRIDNWVFTGVINLFFYSDGRVKFFVIIYEVLYFLQGVKPELLFLVIIFFINSVTAGMYAIFQCSIFKIILLKFPLIN